MKSKTIIISSANNTGRGILTLYEEDDLLKCKLRLYGVEKLNKFAKIGLYNNNEVFTANLLNKGGVYETSFVGNFDLNSDFYSAIIKTDNNNEVLLSGGTYAGFYFNDFIDEEINDKLKNSNLSINEQEEANYENTDNKKTPTKDEDCEKCATCKYKEFFYNSNLELFNANANNNENENNFQCENLNDFELKNNENLNTISNRIIKNEENLNKISNNLDKNEENLSKTTKILENETNIPTNENENKKSGIPSILEQIIPQFNYIFKNYPENVELNNLINNSKFVCINDNEYSLGAIYENEQIKYICYALKSKYNTPPPDELGKHNQWLPLDKDDPLSDGYYLVFQDALDLKIIDV